MKNARILVTGGAGFIGSHITEMLCDKGHRVTVLDDLSFGFERFVDKRSKFIEGSLSDEKLLLDILKNIDIVIHLAASSIISLSFENPNLYFENNLLNGINLLEAMQKTGVKRIINSSTTAVYGDQKSMPIKEDAPKNPLSPYGSSKLAFEQSLICYYNSFGIDSVSLRYFNVYGPRDEQHPQTRAVPMWIRAILENKPIPWYWQGKQIRDYVYVRDIAKAHIDVLSLKGAQIFNIGSGKKIVMKDILRILEKIAGRKLHTLDMGERKGDPMEAYADISKIKKAVDWEPEIELEAGLRETFSYYKKNGIS